MHGLFLSGWSGAGRAYVKDKVARGEWKVFVQMTSRKDEEHLDAPSVFEVIPGDQNKQILTLLFERQILGRPFVAPPGVPPLRVAALRKAFDETMRDPALLAEAKRLLLDIEPMTGEEVAALVKSVLATPPAVVTRVRKVLDGK